MHHILYIFFSDTGFTLGCVVMWWQLDRCKHPRIAKKKKKGVERQRDFEC